MQSSIGIGISLPKDLMQKIDIDRGDIPRSRYVLRLLEKQYGFRQMREKGSLDREFETLGSSKPLRP
jgi:metal-responsive CopG/Arc/MetJ family transcriptional regulator